MANLRATHDQAIVIPREDIHAELADCAVKGGFIDSAVFGRVKADNPIQYKIPAKRNSFGFVEVISLGEGTPNGQGIDKPEVKVGDIVGLDMCQVSHVVAHQHQTKWFVPWKTFLCRFDVGGKLPVPLMNWIMSEHDDEAVNRILFKDKLLVAPRNLKTGGIHTNQNPNSKHRMAVEKVLAVGQGRFVKKSFVEVGCKPGDAIMFMPTNCSVDLHLYGTRHRFTPWSEVEGVLEDYANG